MKLYFLVSETWWTRFIVIGCFLIIFIFWLVKNRSWEIWRKGRFSDRATESQVITQMIHSAPYAGPYFILNGVGKIVGINERLKKLLGWHEDEIVGFNIDRIFASKSVVEFENFKKQHSTNDDERIIQLDAKDRNDKNLCLETSVWQWTNELKVVYYTVVVRDITGKKKEEQTSAELNKTLDTLRQLYHDGEKIGNVCFWELNLVTGTIESSANFNNIFGIKGVDIPVENIVKRVMPEDKKRVADTMTKAKENKTGYEMTYRIVGLDGYINTIRSIASGVKNKKGDLISYIGMAQLMKKEVPNWQ